MPNNLLLSSYFRFSRRCDKDLHRVECREMSRENVLFPAIASRRCVTQNLVKRRTTPRGVPAWTFASCAKDTQDAGGVISITWKSRGSWFIRYSPFFSLVIPPPRRVNTIPGAKGVRVEDLLESKFTRIFPKLACYFRERVTVRIKKKDVLN